MSGQSFVEIENQVLRNRLVDMKKLMREFISAVDRYVEPKPGEEYMHRSKLLAIMKNVKDSLK